MSDWLRWALSGAGIAVAFASGDVWAEQPASPARAALPLVSLDGNSQLGSPKSMPIADPKGDSFGVDKTKLLDAPHPPEDPKVGH